jgi:hypothetical protein
MEKFSDFLKRKLDEGKKAKSMSDKEWHKKTYEKDNAKHMSDKEWHKKTYEKDNAKRKK